MGFHVMLITSRRLLACPLLKATYSQRTNMDSDCQKGPCVHSFARCTSFSLAA